MNRRLPFNDLVERIRRQHQWLIDLAHLLDPEQETPMTSALVSQAVNRYLNDLLASAIYPLKSALGFHWGSTATQLGETS